MAITLQLSDSKNPSRRTLINQLSSAVDPEEVSKAVGDLIEHYPKNKALGKKLAEMKHAAERGLLHPEHANFLLDRLPRLYRARPETAVRLFLALSKYEPLAGWFDDRRREHYRRLAVAKARMELAPSATGSDMDTCRDAVQALLARWKEVIAQRFEADNAFLKETAEILSRKPDRADRVTVVVLTNGAVLKVVADSTH